MKEVIVGRILSMQDRGGRVSININDNFPQEPEFEGPLFVYIDKLAVPLFIDHVARRTSKQLIVSLADIDTPRRAAILHGLDVYILKEEAGKENDEFLPEDLIGFSVVIKGGKVGQIIDYYDSDMNPLLEIRIEGRDILIPFADEYITEFDVKAGSIALNLPDGLSDIND